MKPVLLATALVAASACGGLPPSQSALEHNALGAELLARGDLDAAEARFRLALEYRPGFAEARANLGLVAAERDDLDEALAHVEGALSLDQDFGLGWSSLGVVCERRGDLDEAEAAYVRALAIDPGLATPRRNLALLLLRRERFAEARAHLSRLAAVDPDDLEAHAHLAWSELRLRRPRAALDRASAILEREPGHPRALMVRGAARARLGDLDAAAEDLFRAARTRELRVAALARLLLVMHLRGDVTEARRVAAVLAREGGDDPAAVFALAQHARENE